MNKVLLGGLLGAAALTAAAYIFDEDDDKENGPRKYDLSKKVAGDTVQEVLKQLDKLDWDLINLHLELASLYADFSSVAGDCDIKLEDTTFLEKIEDYVHQGSAIFIRGNFISKLNDFRRKAISAYTSNKEVIIKANQFLKEHDLPSVIFKGVKLRKDDFDTSSSLDNENCDNQVTADMDGIEKFINEADDRLKSLTERLGKLAG